MSFEFPKLTFPVSNFKVKEEGGKMYIFDDSRRKYVILTPEEWVRQNCLHYLRDHKSYPISLLAVEKGFKLNGLVYRFDIVAYSKSGKPVMLIECKAPEITITQKTFDQISVYNLELKVPYLLITNGIEIFCCKTDAENLRYTFLKELPCFSDLSI
jgi:hypothetical protein